MQGAPVEGSKAGLQRGGEEGEPRGKAGGHRPTGVPWGSWVWSPGTGPAL